MTCLISLVMTGQLPTPPYQSVFWTVYGEPDNTGALSGYGAGFLLNVGVDSVTCSGAQVDPLSLQVGGDLTGNLPNPYVSGLQGNPIAANTPLTNQVLAWSGAAWTPVSGVPSLLAGAGLFIGSGAYNVGQNADGSIIVNTDDIQLKPAYQTLLDNATSTNVSDTLVKRDGYGDFAMHDLTMYDLTCHNITMGDSIFFTTPGLGYFSIGESSVTGFDNSSPIFFGNGGAVDGTSGDFFIFTGSITGSGSSGQLFLTSGEALNSGSGQVTFQSGPVTGGSSGAATFGSGSCTTGITGQVTLASGNASGSGAISGNLVLKSGTVTTGSAGAVLISSGNASGLGGGSGGVSVGSGTGTTGLSGVLVLYTGDVTSGNSGDIDLFTGANSGGTSGSINLWSRGGGGVSFGTLSPSFAGGKNIIYIANATASASGTPSGGGILEVIAGALWYKGSSGTLTKLANA